MNIFLQRKKTNYRKLRITIENIASVSQFKARTQTQALILPFSHLIHLVVLYAYDYCNALTTSQYNENQINVRGNNSNVVVATLNRRSKTENSNSYRW